jgi:hypothetical protein
MRLNFQRYLRYIEEPVAMRHFPKHRIVRVRNGHYSHP